MGSGPSKIAEAVVAFFVPPACREEVLGDLHERFQSPMQYATDAFFTVPLVIISRMRRVTDPQILGIQALALYMSFLGAAWLGDGAVLHAELGLFRLAIPAALAALGLMLEDTYASPGRRSPLNLARGPLLGVAMALASQAMMWITNSDFALPRRITFYGCAMSLFLSSAIRMLFPPVTDQLLGANAPALWMKQAGESREGRQAVPGTIPALVALAILLAVVVYQMRKG